MKAIFACLLVIGLALHPGLALSAEPGLSQPEAGAVDESKPCEIEEGSDHADPCGFRTIFGWHDDEDGRRVNILDLGLVSLFSLRQRDPDYSRVEIVELPLITAFESRRSEVDRSLKLLDIPLFSLFELESDDQGRHDIGFVNLPVVGSLYRHSVDDEKRRINVLYLFRSETPREDPSKLGRARLN